METKRQIPLLDLRAQFAPLRDETMAAIARVVDDQKFVLGAEVEQLERDLAVYSGAAYGVGCASGSDALLLALLASGIQPGDRVVTTPFTFFATAGSISQAGAIPVFADIDPATFNLSIDALCETLRKTEGVRAIIPVHLFGACADMDPILELGREYHCPVIEDAAQAIGAEYKGRRAGGIGDYGCLSFFPSKNLGAFGDGGMIFVNDEAAAAKLKALRVHGRTGKYFHEWIGVNSRLDALQAAVLRVKFRYLDEWTEGRRRNADRYRELLAGTPIAAPTEAAYVTRHVYNQFVIRAPERDGLKAWLAERGVGTEIYYPLPLDRQPCYRGLGYSAGDFPESERAAAEVLSLPVHASLKPGDIEYVCGQIKLFYNSSAT